MSAVNLALRPGDRVAVVAPSSPVLSSERLDEGLGILRAWGLEVVEGRSLRASHGHLAGTDEARAEDLQAALDDPSVRAVFAGRGGYGAQRISDRIDWSAVEHDPTLLVGFSDVCALHHAVWRRFGLIGIHGPFVGRLGHQGAGTRSALRRLLMGETPDPVPIGGGQVLVAGRAEGPLLGGNLSMIATNVGSPDQLDPDGAILVLEDVHEPPYAIDRMLTQLRRAGVVEGCAAVVCGAWTRCEPPRGRPSSTVAEVLADRLGDLGVPVVTGLPIGHVDDQVPFAHGAVATLDTAVGELRTGALTRPRT